VRLCQSVSAVRVVDVQVLVRLRSCYYHVTDVGFVIIAPKVVTYNGRDLVDIIQGTLLGSVIIVWKIRCCHQVAMTFVIV